MFEGSGTSEEDLKPVEAQILRLLRSKSRTEKKLSKELRIDPIVLSPIVTDLIMKGYLEIFRRRRMYFFTREVCTITVEGVSALERMRTPFQKFVGMIQKRAVETLDNLIAESPALKMVAMSARTFYKVAKAIA